jgi:membrane protease YdiL (CAAX protease family)
MVASQEEGPVMKKLLSPSGLMTDRTEMSSPAMLVLLASVPVLLVVYRYYGTAAFFDEQLRALGAAGPGLVNGATYSFLCCFLLLMVLPALIMKGFFKEPLSRLGLCRGDWRVGLRLLAVLGPLIGLVLILPASRMPAFQAEYPLYREAAFSPPLFVAYELLYGLYYLGWEFFFRGYMLFGLAKRFGAINSILIQTIPSTLMHIGKPDGEVFAAMAAGLVFGAIALRTRSVVYVFLLHWFIGILLDILITYAA